MPHTIDRQPVSLSRRAALRLVLSGAGLALLAACTPPAPAASPAVAPTTPAGPPAATVKSTTAPSATPAPQPRTGGTLRLTPGREGTQAKDIPIEVFFKKLIGVRDRLRVLEQKINGHAALSPEEKLELQGYITRCYGGLTTFNVLFGNRASSFVGQADRDE